MVDGTNRRNGVVGLVVITFLVTSAPAASQQSIDVRLDEDEFLQVLSFGLKANDGSADGFLTFDNDISSHVWKFFNVGTFELQRSDDVTEIVLNAELAGLTVGAESPSVRYLADSNDDGVAANHIWYENSTSGTPTDWRMMQLTEAAGGTLFVDGPVNSNHNFDLAESYWEAEPIEPGQLVAIDLDRTDAVVLASGAGQRTLLGVASAKPGFVLGGGAFSRADLRATWGEEIAAEYDRFRPQLEQQVYEQLPEFRAMADRVASLSAFEAELRQEAAETRASLRSELRAPAGPANPERIAAAYEVARHDYDTQMFDRTLRLFFQERFSAVALAGRVPVRVDASFGAIEPGDFLTASPIPGVAMKATGPGIVIGTALEALASGEGTIQLFVDRGWFGGESIAASR